MPDFLMHWFASENVIDLTLWTGLVVFLAGFCAGFIDAIVGGGGLVATPVLLAIGMPIHNVLATNKLQAICGTSFATWQYHKNGLIQLKALFPLAFVLTIVWALIGALLLKITPVSYIGKIMPILMSIILIYRIIYFKHGLHAKHKPIIAIKWFIVIFTCILGLYDGFFGPGIGTLWTFAFVTFYGLDSLSAAANSRFLNFASNIGALIILIPSGLICFKVGMIMGFAQLFGANLGVHMSIKNGVKFINITFIIVLTVIVSHLFFKYY